MNIVSDTGVVFAREIRPELRNPIGLLFGMIQPLIFLALFGPLLPGTPGGGQTSPWQWFVPGIVVMLGLSGTGSAGYYLLVEGGGGSLERMLVTPLNRTAMLVGRTMKEIVTLLAQAALIIVVVLPFGFRPHLLGTVAGLLVLAVLGVGLGSFSFALALAARRQPSIFYGVQQTLLFPLMLLSGVLLPVENAPSWLYGMARANPVTYVVEAERALFAGDLAHPSVPYGVAAAVVVALAGLAVGTRGMRRASL
ncbi:MULTISPECIES: ABC transporter permease [Streptosporangium]|uniref:Transport permease protein n=1 Tax=Streptosporangium brasiliense TaxID=47480 RepID=A0ABT9R9R0_9ACTN|nr:ABC transporter permease [Streptosporangium brasiliense]MDP9865979.1 ABC-2 type transport system permease protein [Streptosporangium brasiliense]